MYLEKPYPISSQDLLDIAALEINPLSDYKRMLETEALSDFKLIMNDNKTLKAHKAILSARSPVFFSMLTNEMQEANNNQVEIPDFDYETMKELLRFVYCGELQNLDEVATDLIFAAEKYEITQLKDTCASHIISRLSIDNVIEALIIADLLSDMTQLTRKCVEFAVE